MPVVEPRIALVAGATGLVGRALVRLLLGSLHCARVHALVRRAPAGLPDHPKLQLHVVDFARLPPLPAADDVYLALGTTIKQAGSQAAFRNVDFDAVVNTARAARDAGARRLLVVSALGADSTSRVFYNRVKGDMQQAVSALGYETVVFAQPSLLIGDREALGQPVRPMEKLAAGVLNPVLRLVPRGVRPIAAEDVAHALAAAALEATPGVRVLSSAQMQGAAGATSPRSPSAR
jgi:uncharacterized protein YbjT (DUF2867 family)